MAVYIANWPEKRNNVWKTLLQARAMENQAFCIGLNRIGTDGNDISYSGDSMLIDPWGNIIDQFQEHKEIVKVLSIGYKLLNEIEEKFPAYRDADQFGISL